MTGLPRPASLFRVASRADAPSDSAPRIGAIQSAVGLVILLAALGSAGVSDAAECTGLTTIGVDSSYADTSTTDFLCRGLSQGFYAEDTLITSLTVWVPPPNDYSTYPRILFIGGVRGNGTYDPAQSILGPDTLFHAVHDAVNPIPYRWDFDPPIALPHSGLYAFNMLACEFCRYDFSAVANDPYPQGILCKSDPQFDCYFPGEAHACVLSNLDLCFRIEFCHDYLTDARKMTWGHLKMLYR